MTPFEVVYGQKTPYVLPYLPSVSTILDVDTTLIVRVVILRTMKENFDMDRNHMQEQDDQGHLERHFVEGDWVFLRHQPYKKTFLKTDHCQKLAPKFYGPSTILKHVGPMAYKLALPSHSNLHPVFHVSCLKKMIGTKCQIQTSLPKLDEESSIWFHPQATLDQCEHCFY
jgi:hypothetical protein